MDFQPQSEPEFTLVSTSDNNQFAPYAGAFFPGASRFTIRGGAFTSNVTHNVYNPPQEQPSAFRKFLLGDINLIKEIRLGGQSVAGRQRRRAGVRRLYSARLEGRESKCMTVAMYQGNGSEEEWRQHLAKYEAIRHPHMMQLYGLATTGGLRAMVFHDELIPFRNFLARYQYSPILTTYIVGYSSTQWLDARYHVRSVTQRYSDTDYYDCPVRIRPATGDLCVDLVQAPGMESEFSWGLDIERVESISLDDPHAEAAIIWNLSAHEYHNISVWYPIAQSRAFTVSTQLPIRLPTMFYSDSQHKALFRITEPLDLDIEDFMWQEGDNKAEGEVLENSWTRYYSHQICGRKLQMGAYCIEELFATRTWLVQANHIFTQLQATSHFKDYVCIYGIDFNLRCLPNTSNTHDPDGFLFLCPPQNFRSGLDSFQWPDCPAYWSLDPSGAVRLGTEDARILGFPIIHIETVMYGNSWDDSFYEGLRRFHRGKGFDPDSQDVAMHLDYELFELSTVVDAILPCIEGDRNSDSEAPGYLCDYRDRALCHGLGHYL